MAALELALPEVANPPKKRRTRRDPRPRFLPDLSNQLDPIAGCPELSLPREHLARRVQEIIDQFDFTTLNEKFSSMGRRGHRPKHNLGVLVYGSLNGVHHSSKLEKATQTDAGYRLLSGGRKISSSVLRKFRQYNQAFLKACVEQTVAWAMSEGLIKHEEIAVDSMRLRAHASMKAARTVSRSGRRLKELESIDISTLSTDERTKHEKKVEKHRQALEACERAGSASVILTNPSAAMMKFPDGGSKPGHRITVAAAGVKERIILHVLVDASPTDFGKLPDAVSAARDVLLKCGLARDAKLQVAADPGYYSYDDLAFAAENRDWVDVLIPAKAQANTSDMSRGVFGRARFTILEDNSAICPAGKPMKGPWPQATGQLKWKGVGCADCPLRSKCTKGKYRALYINPELDKLHHLMDDRMARSDAPERYGQRMATVEPVFANIGDELRFRRSSTREPEGIVSEVLLKVIAHNISRLIARRAVILISLRWAF